jgi:hypothetical protein
MFRTECVDGHEPNTNADAAVADPAMADNVPHRSVITLRS